MRKRILEVIVVCLFCILEAWAAYFFVPPKEFGGGKKETETMG